MERKKISVVVSVYNEELSLNQFLTAQTNVENTDFFLP